MGNDEVATRWAASLSLGQLAHLLRNIDAVHGAYYLLMHFWMMLIGGSPTALRVPSVIAMAAAVGPGGRHRPPARPAPAGPGCSPAWSPRSRRP